jgi:hypothetical protein
MEGIVRRALAGLDSDGEGFSEVGPCRSFVFAGGFFGGKARLMFVL